MGNYSYSPGKNIFYKNEWRERYEAQKTWPEDAIDVDDDVFETFASMPPAGKKRDAGSDGFPVWVDLQDINDKARLIRDEFLKATDGMVTTDYTINDIYLTSEQRQELFDIRLGFKKWPKSEGWPLISLPPVPDWILSDLNGKGYKLPEWHKE